jgi:hypothetical protein
MCHTYEVRRKRLWFANIVEFPQPCGIFRGVARVPSCGGIVREQNFNATKARTVRS